MLYRPPDKPDYIEHLNNSLKESNISNTQECYLIGDFNVNLFIEWKQNALGKQYSDSYSQALHIVLSISPYSLSPSVNLQTKKDNSTYLNFYRPHSNELSRRSHLECYFWRWCYPIMNLFTLQEKHHYLN